MYNWSAPRYMFCEIIFQRNISWQLSEIKNMGMLGHQKRHEQIVAGTHVSYYRRPKRFGSVKVYHQNAEFLTPKALNPISTRYRGLSPAQLPFFLFFNGRLEAMKI